MQSSNGLNSPPKVFAEMIERDLSRIIGAKRVQRDTQND